MSNIATESGKGPIECYVTLFSWKFNTHPLRCNANNIELHTFLTHFSWKFDTQASATLLQH